MNFYLNVEKWVDCAKMMLHQIEPSCLLGDMWEKSFFSIAKESMSSMAKSADRSGVFQSLQSNSKKGGINDNSSALIIMSSRVMSSFFISACSSSSNFGGLIYNLRV